MVESMADLISTEAAIKLLLVADKNELKVLEREGWFTRTGPDSWSVAKIVHGRIKQLKDYAEVAGTARMSDIIGVSRVWLDTLSKEGWIKQLGRDRWSISATVKGVFKYKSDAERRISKSAVRSRVNAARAREIELRTAQRAHILCETEEALALADDVFGTLRSELSGLPAMVTRDLEIRREIEKGVNEILNRTAKRLATRAQALRANGEVALRPISLDA